MIMHVRCLVAGSGGINCCCLCWGSTSIESLDWLLQQGAAPVKAVCAGCMHAEVPHMVPKGAIF